MPTRLNSFKMDKNLEKISEKYSVFQVANLRRKKLHQPWSFFVGWLKSTIVWTLIKNMKSPDL